MAAAVVAVVTPIVLLAVPGTEANAVGPLYSPLDRFPSGDTEETFQGPVARADCGQGSKEEVGLQGQVPISERTSGASSEGYWCNMEEVGRYGPDDPNGFEGAEWQLARYGNCAYYSQRLVGAGLPPLGTGLPGTGEAPNIQQERRGTIVLDVSDPEDPKFVRNIFTLGMADPWETLKVHKGRGLLAATNVLDGEGAAFMGIYDISQDCTNPKKLFDGPIIAINHEGNFSTDGMTYYTGGLDPGVVSAMDVSDPTNPKLLTTFFAKKGIHGMSTSRDGKRLYLSHINEDWPIVAVNSTGSVPTVLGGNGMGVYDISEIQDRRPNPQVRLVSALEWQDGQIGQHTLDVTDAKGDPYVIDVEESGHGGARIIDMRDEKNPTVVSKIKTEIMMPENAQTAYSEFKRPPFELGGFFGFGYNFHYCNVDRLDNPAVLACSAFNQGVRVFDIRDFSEPKEIAYFNPGGDGTVQPGSFGGTYSGYPAAMPQFVPERQELWFTDQDRGFYVVRFTNGSWISETESSDEISHGN
jgi:hypothetical protein